ncbi:MAG TPA: glycosyltransferase [Micromonosporaceae bacterium]
MRVGLVCAHGSTPERPDIPVGPRHHVAQVAARLAARGHEVRVYDRRDDPQSSALVEVNGYLVERAPIGPPSRAACGALVPHVPEFAHWLAERWSSGWTPDVLHGTFWLGGLVAASAVRSSRIPVVQTFYSLGAEQARRLGTGYDGPDQRIPLERALTRVIDAAIAQSTDEVEELTRMGLERAAVTVVPVGVDIERFRPEGETADWGGQQRILSPAGLGPGRGHEDLIQAMRLITDAELVIIGGPRPEELADHSQARRLVELAERVGVRDRVRLIGSVPYEEMAAWYRSADVVACAYHYACVGRVPLEAMACGVPVVGYALGAVGDVVVDEVTGRLVPPGDVRGLAVTLRRLLADEAQRFAYGHAAVDRVRCSYTWDRAAAALERVYERVAPAPAVA